jgi:hypothetical protein
LYFSPVIDGDVFTIKNLPPGSYSVFGGPMLFMSAARVEVSSGRQVTVDLPAIEPNEQARANLWTFDRKIVLERKQHTVSQLCELLSAGTDARPRIVADPSIETEKLPLRTRQATIWELLEEVYLTKGWKLTEQDDRTLLLGPEH